MYQPTVEESLAAAIAGGWSLTGAEMDEATRKWIDGHRSEWLDILDRSRELVARGRPFSFRDQVIIPLKYEKGFGCSNTLTAPLSRLCAQMIPGFKDLCQMNRSKVDR